MSLWHRRSSADVTSYKFIPLTITIHYFFFFSPLKARKKKKKESLVSVISPLQTKTQVLHLAVPLFSLLLFPLGSKYPICSFFIIHSSTKRFCLVFIPRCDIFFMLEMFGMPLKVAKSFCGGPVCKKKGVFWFVCFLVLIKQNSSHIFKISPPFTVCEL